MAVFTQRQDLTQQRKRHRFSKVTGWKKYALAAIGYDDKGQKNAKGKFIGGGGFFKNLAGGALAEGTDAEEVIKSNRDAEASHEAGVFDYSTSFMNFGGGGGSSGATSGASTGISGGAGASSGAATSGGGIFSKAGTMGKGADGGATKAGAFMSKVGGGSSETVANGGDSMFTGENGNKLTDQWAKKNKSDIEDDINNEDNYSTEQDYINNEDGDIGVEGEKSSATSDWEGASKATDKMPLVGQGAGLYAEKMAIADAYKSKRMEVAGRTYGRSSAYRV